MARKDRHTLSTGFGLGIADLGLETGPGVSRFSILNPKSEIENPRSSGGRSATSIFLNPLGWGPGTGADAAACGFLPGTDSFVKGLILAQNERWRRGLGMQVERIPPG